MKAFFNYIKAYIIANVSDFAGSTSIRMWNDQYNQSNEKRKEKAFRYPSCFVEFIFEQSDNRNYKIIDYVLTVRFHLGVNNMTYERLNTLDFIDRFKAAMQLLAPSDASGILFTTFQELPEGTYEDSFDDVEVINIDYRTRFRYTGAYAPLTILSGPLSFPNPTVTF